MATSDILSAALLGQLGQVGQRQDPRRAMAARLMTPQQPVAPITNPGAGWAHALTQGVNALSGAWMDGAARDEQRSERDALVQQLTGRQQEQQARSDAAWSRLEQMRGGGMPAPDAAPAEGPPPGMPAPARPRVASEEVPGATPVSFSPIAMQRLTDQESGGNPNARNPRSTATGPQQFIEGTWLQFAQENPALFPAGATRADILAARTNPELSAQATQWYARRNAGELQQAGIPVNDATLALAHGFGGAGARTLLQANPATPVEQVFPPEVIAANPNLRGRTAGDVVGQFQQRFGTPVVQTSAGGPAMPTAGAQPPAQQRPRVTPEYVEGVAALAGQGDARARELLPILRDQLARQDRELATERDRTERQRFQDEQRRLAEEDRRERARLQAEALAEQRRIAVQSRPIPPHIQRAEDQDIEAIGAASGINQSLSTYARMLENERTGQGDPSERLSLGAVGNAVSSARNFAGMSSPNSVNYATFRSDLERLRNESLRLNTGVQTDGDAQRAWNELITNINDPQVVARQLQRIQAINERAVQLREAMIQSRRTGSNLPPLDTSPFRRPVDATPSGPRNDVPQPGAVVDGWRFRGGNPADRNNWERAQ